MSLIPPNWSDTVRDDLHGDTCRCGHALLEHERIAWAHEWACHGPAAEGAQPCACDGCQEEGAPARCACRSFRPVEPERPAEATT